MSSICVDLSMSLGERINGCFVSARAYCPCRSGGAVTILSGPSSPLVIATRVSSENLKRSMMPASDWMLFIGAALLMVLTPGPNLVYLISRSICQGRGAGVFSLLGVVAGFLAHMFAAAAGLTALFIAVPFAYEVLKWAGAAYLLWLAWQALRPGARSVFEGRELAHDSRRRLFAIGFLTNLLNPKVAVFYLSILPQFVAAERGSILAQSVALGTAQIAVSFSVNLLIVLFAGGLASWFHRKPIWLTAQRYVMGTVLGALAVRMALEERRA